MERFVDPGGSRVVPLQISLYAFKLHSGLLASEGDDPVERLLPNDFRRVVDSAEEEAENLRATVLPDRFDDDLSLPRGLFPPEASDHDLEFGVRKFEEGVESFLVTV